MRFQLFVATILAMSLVSMGCGDDTAEPDTTVRVDPTPELPNPENNTPDNNTNNTTPVETYVLRAVSDVDRLVQRAEEIDLKVALVGQRTQAGKSGAQIRYTILQAPTASVQLSAPETTTNAEGQANSMLFVGDTPGEILVRASHAGVAPVEFKVTVDGLPGGSIKVEIRRPTVGPTTLAPHRVRAYPATQFACANFLRRADTPGYAASTVAPGALTTLTDLSSEQSYTVTVQAMGNGSVPIATGCVNTVAVSPEQTTSVIVDLELMPLDPTGTYDVLGNWDLSDAIRQSGGAGSFLVGLIDFLANPGLFIYNLIEPEISTALGFDLSVFGLETLVANTINNFIFQNATLAEFNRIGLGLQNMLNNLEVESELVINKTEDDFTFTGYEHWQKVIFYLTWQCTPTSPVGCGRYEIPVAPNGAIAGLGHVSYEWTGSVTNYNQLTLNSIETRFNYGALMVTILEQVVIPQLTNGAANSISGFLGTLIDCQQLATDISGSTSNLGYNLVNTACVAGLNAAANIVTQPLMAQQVAFDIELDGTATLIDGQSSGFVDAIQNGLNVGTVVNTGAVVKVEWSAELTGL